AMGVWHAETPEDPLTLSLGPGAPRPRESDRPLRRADHSAPMWPAPGAPPPCIPDTAPAAQRSHPGDREALPVGYPPALVFALDGEARQILWFVHREPGAYLPEHARIMQAVVDLATLAVERQSLQRLVRERQRRRDALAALLPALARALDVQAVF